MTSTENRNDLANILHRKRQKEKNLCKRLWTDLHEFFFEREDHGRLPSPDVLHHILHHTVNHLTPDRIERNIIQHRVVDQVARQHFLRKEKLFERMTLEESFVCSVWFCLYH